MIALFKFKREIAAVWAAKNVILSAGEPGFETDTKQWKVGDGYTVWNLLEYQAGTPDDGGSDGPSFVLLYENAKV